MSNREGERIERDRENPGYPINLNKASREELRMVEGIGDTRADQIISHRGRHGDLKSIDDLARIEGFDANAIESIRDRVTV